MREVGEEAGDGSPSLLQQRQESEISTFIVFQGYGVGRQQRSRISITKSSTGADIEDLDADFEVSAAVVGVRPHLVRLDGACHGPVAMRSTLAVKPSGLLPIIEEPVVLLTKDLAG